MGRLWVPACVHAGLRRVRPQRRLLSATTRIDAVHSASYSLCAAVPRYQTLAATRLSPTKPGWLAATPILDSRRSRIRRLSTASPGVLRLITFSRRVPRISRLHKRRAPGVGPQFLTAECHAPSCEVSSLTASAIASVSRDRRLRWYRAFRPGGHPTRCLRVRSRCFHRVSGYLAR